MKAVRKAGRRSSPNDTTYSNTGRARGLWRGVLALEMATGLGLSNPWPPILIVIGLSMLASRLLE